MGMQDAGGVVLVGHDPRGVFLVGSKDARVVVQVELQGQSWLQVGRSLWDCRIQEGRSVGTVRYTRGPSLCDCSCGKKIKLY